jgi:hypothetical protein
MWISLRAAPCVLNCRTSFPLFCAMLLACARPLAAQPSPGEPPITYEVQIDGESFQVEGSQRPIKVKLSNGTTHTLALRVATIQHLRLNSVQLEYGMWAKVTDSKVKDLRVAQIVHELGFSLTLTDVGHLLDAAHQDELLKALEEDVAKRISDRKAADISRTPAKALKIGSSEGKGVRITYTDAEGVARSCMIFVLSGKSYTISAVAESRNQDKDDAIPWVMNALGSIRPLE